MYISGLGRSQESPSCPRKERLGKVQLCNRGRTSMIPGQDTCGLTKGTVQPEHVSLRTATWTGQTDSSTWQNREDRTPSHGSKDRRA